MKRRIDLNAGWAESRDDLDRVEIGDRLVARHVDVVLVGADGQPRVEMAIDSSSGVPRCQSLHLLAKDGYEVRTTDVRNVEIGNWIEAITPLFMAKITERDEGGEISSVIYAADADDDNTEDAKAVLRKAQRASRRRMTPELLARVATTYMSDPDRPALAVRDAFGISERTAFRYIAAARSQGLLSEERQREYDAAKAANLDRARASMTYWRELREAQIKERG